MCADFHTFVPQPPDLVPGEIAPDTLIDAIGADEQSHGPSAPSKAWPGFGHHTAISIVGRQCHGAIRYRRPFLQCSHDPAERPDCETALFQYLQMCVELLQPDVRGRHPILAKAVISEDNGVIGSGGLKEQHRKHD